MMGWVSLAAIGGAAMAAFIALRVPRPLWSFVGSALMLAAAGYALQGRPGLPARPAVGIVRALPEDPNIVDLRDRMFGRFTNDGAYIVAADAMMRVGEPEAATQVVLGGIRAVPASALLWTELGHRLAVRDGNVLSPPALFAFQQATRLAPAHPGPRFFEGLAYVRAGDFASARPLWKRAVQLSPAGTSYRRDILVRLDLLDRYLAAAAKRPR